MIFEYIFISIFEEKIDKKEKANQVAIIHVKKTEINWEVTMILENGAQLPSPMPPIPSQANRYRKTHF